MTRIDKRRTCASCLARIKFGSPGIEGAWTKIAIAPQTFQYLRAAAIEFDTLTADSGVQVTTEEFLDWLAPSVYGSSRYLASQRVQEVSGRNLIEAPNKKGTRPTSHGNPFPLPVLDRRDAA